MKQSVGALVVTHGKKQGVVSGKRTDKAADIHRVDSRAGPLPETGKRFDDYKVLRYIKRNNAFFKDLAQAFVKSSWSSRAATYL